MVEIIELAAAEIDRYAAVPIRFRVAGRLHGAKADVNVLAGRRITLALEWLSCR